MNNFLTYFKESIIDLPKNSLDPTVFQFNEGLPPILQPSIKAQILQQLMEFKKLINIKNIYIIGSILTKSYDKNSDIDVTIEVGKEDLDPDIGAIARDRVIAILKNINGKMAVGTTHPINFYITTDFNTEKADAIYDFEMDKFIKEPKNDLIDLKDYMKSFEDMVSTVDLTTGKLRRDLIDYEKLKEYDSDKLLSIKSNLNSKIYEINKSVESLIEFKKELRARRKAAFDAPMTIEDIQKYSSKNKLPANVIYKLFQKYYYLDLIRKLEDIVLNRDLENTYIDKIEDLVGYKESVSFSDFVLNERKIRKISAGNVNWKDPISRKKYQDAKFNIARSMARKTMTQVPDSHRDERFRGRPLRLSHKVVSVAKKASSGLWRVTPSQAHEISGKYYFIMPDEKNPTKHLGNTGILLWRKAPNLYYLVKHKGL